VTTTLETLARRTTVVLAAAATVVAVAGPANADVPEGWSDPDKVSVLHALLVLGGIPLLLFVVISLLVYIPSLIRGEHVRPGSGSAGENQWFGGPRKGTSELAAPDTEESKAGGASGRW
jgi:hypothetical protein